MTDIELLLAIEGIRRTKATYWYALDTKDWKLLASVFASDAVADFRGARDLKPGESYDLLPQVEEALAAGDAFVARGNRNIAALSEMGVGNCVTFHHGGEPIIDVTGSDSAKAVWPVFDILDSGSAVITAYGHYHETYCRQDGGWRIELLQTTRLRVEGRHPAHPSRE